MSVLDERPYKVYYERLNRRDGFKKVKGVNKKHAESKFLELLPGRKILRTEPVIANSE